MTLTIKEIDALRWIMEQGDLVAVDVCAVRDRGDVGWLLATVHLTVRGTARKEWRRYIVSPLGHVYKDDALDALGAEWKVGRCLRSGPGVLQEA